MKIPDSPFELQLDLAINVIKTFMIINGLMLHHQKSLGQVHLLYICPL